MVRRLRAGLVSDHLFVFIHPVVEETLTVPIYVFILCRREVPLIGCVSDFERREFRLETTQYIPDSNDSVERGRPTHAIELGVG